MFVGVADFTERPEARGWEREADRAVVRPARDGSSERFHHVRLGPSEAIRPVFAFAKSHARRRFRWLGFDSHSPKRTFGNIEEQVAALQILEKRTYQFPMRFGGIHGNRIAAEKISKGKMEIR